jgi:hypothetical protein
MESSEAERIFRGRPFPPLLVSTTFSPDISFPVHRLRWKIHFLFASIGLASGFR